MHYNITSEINLALANTLFSTVGISADMVLKRKKKKKKLQDPTLLRREENFFVSLKCKYWDAQFDKLKMMSFFFEISIESGQLYHLYVHQLKRSG